MSAFFASKESVNRLQAEARGWIGTPFVAHCRRRRIGCDCVGMAAGVYSALGFSIPKSWPKYSVGAGAYLDASKVAEVVGGSPSFQAVEPASLDELKPGDLIGFKIGRVIHHVGIFLGDDLFLHCTKSIGVDRGTLRDPAWANRMKAIWRPQNV